MQFVFLAGDKKKPSCRIFVSERRRREVLGVTCTTSKPEFDSSRWRQQKVVHIVLVCVRRLMT